MFPLQINWGKLVEPDFWFRTYPLRMYPSTLNFLIYFFAGFIVLAVILKIWSIKEKDIFKRRILRKLWVCFLTVGLIGQAINFFTWSRAIYLGMRFWYLVLAVVFIVWIILIIIYAVKKVPKLKEKDGKKDEYEKYLPK